MAMMVDKVFIDTNVLVYLSDEKSKFYEDAYKKFMVLLSEKELWFSYQVIREFSVILSRSGRILNPLAPSELVKAVIKWKKVLKVCDENKVVNERLMKLIEKYEIKGKRIHDANIVATMLSNGIKKIFTYNVDDFKNFAEIEIIK